MHRRDLLDGPRARRRAVAAVESPTEAVRGGRSSGTRRPPPRPPAPRGSHRGRRSGPRRAIITAETGVDAETQTDTVTSDLYYNTATRMN